MHEFAIAQQVVERAAEAAADNDADAVTELTLELGEAAHLNPDQLRYCIEVASEGTPVGGADVTITPVPPEATCSCGWEGEPEQLSDVPVVAPDLTCPECGEGVTLTRGRECRLVAVSVPDQEDTA